MRETFRYSWYEKPNTKNVWFYTQWSMRIDGGALKGTSKRDLKPKNLTQWKYCTVSLIKMQKCYAFQNYMSPPILWWLHLALYAYFCLSAFSQWETPMFGRKLLCVFLLGNRGRRYFLFNQTVPAMPSPYFSLSLKHDSPNFWALTFLEKSVIVSKVISFFKICNHFLIYNVKSNIWISICLSCFKNK